MSRDSTGQLLPDSIYTLCTLAMMAREPGEAVVVTVCHDRGAGLSSPFLISALSHIGVVSSRCLRYGSLSHPGLVSSRCLRYGSLSHPGLVSSRFILALSHLGVVSARPCLISLSPVWFFVSSQPCLISFHIGVVSSRCLFSLSHLVVSSRCLISLSHLVVSSRCLISLSCLVCFVFFPRRFSHLVVLVTFGESTETLTIKTVILSFGHSVIHSFIHPSTFSPFIQLSSLSTYTSIYPHPASSSSSILNLTHCWAFYQQCFKKQNVVTVRCRCHKACSIYIARR